MHMVDRRITKNITGELSEKRERREEAYLL